MEESKPTQPELTFWQKYEKWIRKNTFTMIGIIIIALLVLYDTSTAWKSKAEATMQTANKCNEYWIEQVKIVCPALLGKDIQGNRYNFTFLSNTT